MATPTNPIATAASVANETVGEAIGHLTKLATRLIMEVGTSAAGHLLGQLVSGGKPPSPEAAQKAREAVEHLSRGEHAEAKAKLIEASAFGWGLEDEGAMLEMLTGVVFRYAVQAEPPAPERAEALLASIGDLSRRDKTRLRRAILKIEDTDRRNDLWDQLAEASTPEMIEQIIADAGITTEPLMEHPAVQAGVTILTGAITQANELATTSHTAREADWQRRRLAAWERRQAAAGSNRMSFARYLNPLRWLGWLLLHLWPWHYRGFRVRSRLFFRSVRHNAGRLFNAYQRWADARTTRRERMIAAKAQAEATAGPARAEQTRAKGDADAARTRAEGDVGTARYHAFGDENEAKARAYRARREARTDAANARHERWRRTFGEFFGALNRGLSNLNPRNWHRRTYNGLAILPPPSRASRLRAAVANLWNRLKGLFGPKGDN